MERGTDVHLRGAPLGGDRTVHPHRFLTLAERERVAAAVKEVAGKTSGEIRVHLDRHCPQDPQAAATRVFHQHGLHGKAERHGVLIYLATADRKFAVVGDDGIHGKVGPRFWEEVRDRMAKAFQENRFGDGIAEAVREIGEKLPAAYPKSAG